MIVQVAPSEHYQWLAERAKLTIGPTFAAIEAVSGDRILGMVGFDGWSPGSVSLHIALDSPIALRGLVKQGFGLAFGQCGRGLVTCVALSTNVRSRRLIQHLGFREVYRGRDYWARGVDMLLYEMRREECRWIDRNGPAVSTHHEPEVAQ